MHAHVLPVIAGKRQPNQSALSWPRDDLSTTGASSTRCEGEADLFDCSSLRCGTCRCRVCAQGLRAEHQIELTVDNLRWPFFREGSSCGYARHARSGD